MLLSLPCNLTYNERISSPAAPQLAALLGPLEVACDDRLIGTPADEEVQGYSEITSSHVLYIPST